VFFVVSAIVVTLFLWHSSNVRQREVLIDRVRLVVKEAQFDEAFKILDDSSVTLRDIKDKNLLMQIGGTLSIYTMPEEVIVTLARVHAEPALSKGKEFGIGSTNIENHLLVAGEYFVNLDLEGMNSLVFLVQIVPNESLEIQRTLLEESEEYKGMTKIDKGLSHDGHSIQAFLIDKHEITNAEYFDFVSARGYQNENYWPEDLLMDGVTMSRESALKKLVDKTGIQAPRFWSGGKYPEGKENHPVVGISWYEAKAYAIWAGKDLPNWDQWWRAAFGETESARPWGNDVRTTHMRANFGFKGTQTVGAYPFGVSPFGCFDMAGNVREWIGDLRSTHKVRTVVGGSWKDPEYMFEPVHAETFYPDFASEDIGFRCVKIISQEK
jgi:hypothetical protein